VSYILLEPEKQKTFSKNNIKTLKSMEGGEGE